MRDKLKELEKRVSKLEKHIAEDKEMKDKYRFRIQWKPLASDEALKLKEQKRA